MEIPDATNLGGLAFFMVAVVQSIPPFDPKIVSTGPKTAAFGFLIGFFSDNAIAKLAEVAETLLGRTLRTSNSREPSKHPPNQHREDAHKDGADL